jgi:hypothetical protein
VPPDIERQDEDHSRIDLREKSLGANLARGRGREIGPPSRNRAGSFVYCGGSLRKTPSTIAMSAFSLSSVWS